MWHLAPVCLVELAILLAFLVISTPDQATPRAVDGLVLRLREQPWNPTAAWRGAAILVSALAAFVLAGEMGLSPAVVAALGGACALMLSGVPGRTLLGKVGLGDIAFFACLFVMVGAVEASGLFAGLGRLTGRLLWASPALGAVTIAWAAALVTALLNAGPTTALLVHVLRSALAPWAAGETVWWALSLGVCAGSSATLTGATAGPVSASLMEARGRELSFRRFARTGIPMMFGFMLVNTLYLLWMVRRH
jgi:Na+/H+ antiporter NhaD/arsenite permease-like protein